MTTTGDTGQEAIVHTYPYLHSPVWTQVIIVSDTTPLAIAAASSHLECAICGAEGVPG